MKGNLTVKRLAQMGIIIALGFLLKLVTYYFPFGRVTLVPIAFCLSGVLFGPVWGGILGAVIDILINVLIPSGGAFFPGFTLNAIVIGVFAGLYGPFKKSQVTIVETLIYSFITGFVDLGLNAFWLSYLSGKAFFVILTPRIITTIVMVFVNGYILRYIIPLSKKLVK